MKRLFFSIIAMLFAGFITINAQCCPTAKKTSKCNDTTEQAKSGATDVKVVYFHATRRCATCNAVEDVTKKALAEFYGDEVSFSSINREIEKENELIKKHKISGQTLLVIKGDKVVNLTNDAFMNARTKPEKLKEKLKETINTL